MKPSILLPSLGLFALQPGVARAYWRMACGVSQTSRTDPILSPGTISGHVHKFSGGNNVNTGSTQDNLLTSTCSTCEVQEDKSAYWTPQLYYAHTSGTYEEVQNEGMTVYYVGRGGDSSNTVAFPPGFKMISGNSLARSYDSQNLTYQDTRPIADRQHYMFDTNCVNGMRAQINFQSCWDGQNLFLPGSQHVAYLSGIDYGSCPSTHPIPIPGLFFEVLYWTNRIDQSAGGQFVFSNGDATGYGFHGDFLNGWDQGVQTAAVQQCLYTDNGGVISACSALAASSDINIARSCPESPSVWNEPVHGSLSSLPGCNPVTSGPGLAPQVICPLNSNTPTQSQAASLASSTSLTSSTTFLSEGTLPTTTSTATSPTTDLFNSSTVSTLTLTSTSSQSTRSDSASVYTNSTGSQSFTGAPSTTSTPTFTNTFSQTPIVSFTTIFVTATPTPTELIAGTRTLISNTSTTASSFRRRRRDVGEDLARIFDEVVATKENDDAGSSSGKEKDDPEQEQQGDGPDLEEDEEDQRHATSHSSGMGCMLWGSCA